MSLIGDGCVSKLLDDVISDKIGLDICLQRLLVIANKLDNKDLVKWCMDELNGYSKGDVPEYRKYKSKMIVYSGIFGNSYQMTNQPIQAGYLSEETLKNIEEVYFYENIYDVIDRKNKKEELYRDLTRLSGEIYMNTDQMLQCSSIRQIISSEMYSKIYAAVKVRVINILCSLESAKINIDKSDIDDKIIYLRKENEKLYETIIVKGEHFQFGNKGNKILWNVIIPIITAIIGGVVTTLITNLFNN